MSNIKKRLKDAYDSVIFYANKTWTNDYYLYQKANQELYARYVKIQETFTEEVTRPRTVRDSIPQSKLAQYSNYKYDESRELSYTPNGPDVTFHYPCQFRQMTVNEPWMLPEVEQLFIWLTYSPKFNLTEYINLVDFDHAENYDRTGSYCGTDVFHMINPRFYENFERTPGKPRFTKYECYVDVDSKLTKPPFVNFNSFEDMTIKMRFDVDTIKNIWKTNRSSDLIPRKKIHIYKSSFNNIFIDENSSSQKFLQYPEYFNIDRNPYHFNDLQEKANDFRNLQNLTDALKKMKEPEVGARNPSKPAIASMRSDTECSAKTPTRRLYSDVVQGVASNKPSGSKTHLSLESPPQLVHSTSCKDIQFAMDAMTDDPVLCNPSHTYKLITSKSRPPSPSISWLDQSRGKQDSKLFLKTEERKVTDCAQSKTCTSHTAAHMKSFPTSSLFTESFSNSPISCYNSFGSGSYQNCVPTNFITTEYQSNEVQAAYSAFHSPHVQNVYPGNFYANSPYQYPQGNLYCNSFSTSNYPTNPYSNSYPYSTQLSTNTRNFVQQKHHQNAMHYNSGQQWIINQFRTPSVFNVAHFPPQPYFLLPPHFPKQRWVQTAHYMRSPTPQTYHVNFTPPHTPPQNWNLTNQPVYKSTSTQHIGSQNYTFEGSSSMHNLDVKQKMKSRKINSQVNLAFKKARGKSPEGAYSMDKEYSYGTKFKSSSTSKRSSLSSDLSCPINLAKALKPDGPIDSLDYKLEKKELVANKDSKVFCDPNSSTSMMREYDCEMRSLPVTATTSEELERQALDEYESSNESFYKELERQAEEQYEDSENLSGPPNENLHFGGHASSCRLSLSLGNILFYPDLLASHVRLYVYQYA